MSCPGLSADPIGLSFPTSPTPYASAGARDYATRPQRIASLRRGWSPISRGRPCGGRWRRCPPHPAPLGAKARQRGRKTAYRGIPEIRDNDDADGNRWMCGIRGDSITPRRRVVGAIPPAASNRGTIGGCVAEKPYAPPYALSVFAGRRGLNAYRQ